jgi:hypothetical protein
MVVLRPLGSVALTSMILALACGGQSFGEGEAAGAGATGGSSGKSAGGTGAAGGATGGTAATGMGAIGGTGATGMGAVGGTGATGMGAIGGTGMGALGGTGNTGATGGAGNVGGSISFGGSGGTGGVAGGSCTDPDVTTEDPRGIWTTGTTTGTNGEFTDACDDEGNLLERFCETNCATTDAAPLPPADGGTSGIEAPCYLLGTVRTTLVTCPELCLDGECVPVLR